MTTDKDSSLTTTEDDIAWTVDDDTLPYWEKSVRNLGFLPWPDHVPMPLDGYEYQCFGPVLFASPACSRWHRLIFRLPARVAWWLYAKTGGK